MTFLCRFFSGFFVEFPEFIGFCKVFEDIRAFFGPSVLVFSLLLAFFIQGSKGISFKNVTQNN